MSCFSNNRYSLFTGGLLCFVTMWGCSADAQQGREYEESLDGAVSIAAEQANQPAEPGNNVQPQIARVGNGSPGINGSAVGIDSEASKPDKTTDPADEIAGTTQSDNTDADPVLLMEGRPALVSLPTLAGDTLGPRILPWVKTVATDQGIDPSGFTFPTPGEDREIKLLVPEKTFSRIDPDNALRLTYDDIDLLKVLNMEPVPADAVTYFPDWLKQLDGERVRLRGFMMPPLREHGLTGFGFARDNELCCFGRYPKSYDVFPVYLKDGETTDYIIQRPFDVVGTFRIVPEEFDGKIENIYMIEEAIVLQ